ncbi:MAG: TldD/PmbA family protein [Candidatus Eisenbacteria bacterium]|uniref:TldD/PmbA family protein n=1 Tax=Eiseniibacteriota bacterium TaxID=2212470 RepID=A0A948WBY2_UNCEI|nr:TldD/PmbA family protein [Candidatus Eisenbacteria bacterium]MBU1949340.1 TldD/PmbA family protein [Candidatus Eisenbacteria bacterium]MBU2690413.1 TldD/PmbA family protein [Candidatus Eisenbacteria bacterium]
MSAILLDHDQVPGLSAEDVILAQWAIEEARRLGATYAEARWGLLETRRIRIKDQHVALLAHTNHRGLGLRVLVDGAWGFVSHPLQPPTGETLVTPAGEDLLRGEIQPDETHPPISAIDDIFDVDLSARGPIQPHTAAFAYARLKGTIISLAEAAVAMARAAAAHNRRPIQLAPAAPQSGVWRTDRERDPFEVPLEEMVEYLMTAEKVSRQAEKDLVSTETWLTAWRKAHWLCTSEGTLILQEILECGGGLKCLAHTDGVTQERTYPGLRGCDCETGGYERLLAHELQKNAPRVAAEAVALTTAPPCPSKVSDLVIDGSLAAIQIHETIGHAVELDRVFGSEESLAGGSHLTPDKLDWFRFGSDLINVSADATAALGLGSFGYDDEGTPAQRVPIIKNGVFSGYLTNRETAGKLGILSGGAARAQDWSHMPLIRMTNVNLAPGGWTFDKLIEDTENGFYFETSKNPSIDHLRLNFFVAAEMAWEIRDGKKIRMYRDPAYGGISYQLWRACDAITDYRHWRIWGIPNCGKGDPKQIGHVGHGASPLRMRNVRIGSRS